MIDLAQADSAMRQQDKPSQFYYVVMVDGTINGSFDSHANAISYAVKHWDNVVRITTKP